MVKFERQMRESSTLFRDHQRILDISQRIAEQNDQIVSMLLELNAHPQIPSRLRFDLKDPASAKQPSEHQDVDRAAAMLRRSRHEVQKGDIQQPEYHDYEHSLLEKAEFTPRVSYSDLVYQPKRAPLERAQHTADNSNNSLAGGFLSSKQEEQYLQSLDKFLLTGNTHPRAHATSNIGYPHPEKSAEREREAQIRNPVSVYNWLRKNQPQVFLQDPDHDKTKTAAGSRKSKRESIAKAPKVEPELYDDEGIALEPMAKGKRKRDEDTGYRPKGGHARPAKRRKEDSERRSKRASMDISGS